ncbi:hypothetical protein ACS0TY_029638 [Phlomoides rotata]
MKGADQLNLPAGFRFHPTDDELVVDYLCRKCAGQHISVPIIADIDLYKFDPWQLPAMALYGEKEWYFFSPRDRKYPNGSRPNRMAGTGYWKATGADKPVGKPKTLGIKKALVFYAGKAPRGVKTNWIMHEYRLANVDRSAGKRNNLRLDDWVLCRLYNKKGILEKHYNNVEEGEMQQLWDRELEQKPVLDEFNSVPKMMHTESSSSEHSTDKEEIQSEPPKWNEFDNYLDFQLQDNHLFSSQMQYNNDQFFVFPDMFGYMQKPF